MFVTAAANSNGDVPGSGEASTVENAPPSASPNKKTSILDQVEKRIALGNRIVKSIEENLEAAQEASADDRHTLHPCNPNNWFPAPDGANSVDTNDIHCNITPFIFKLTVSKYKPGWFESFCLGVLGVIQIVVGAVLCITGVGASIGMFLIMSGIGDVLQALKGGEVDWGNYFKGKAISLACYAACCVGMAAFSGLQTAYQTAGTVSERLAAGWSAAKASFAQNFIGQAANTAATLGSAAKSATEHSVYVKVATNVAKHLVIDYAAGYVLKKAVAGPLARKGQGRLRRGLRDLLHNEDVLRVLASRYPQSMKSLVESVCRAIQNFACDTVLQQIFRSAVSGAASGSTTLRVVSCVYSANEFDKISDRIVTAAKNAILDHLPPTIPSDLSVDEGVAAGLINREWRAPPLHHEAFQSEDALKTAWAEHCPNRNDNSKRIMLSQYRFYKVYKSEVVRQMGDLMCGAADHVISQKAGQFAQTHAGERIIKKMSEPDVTPPQRDRTQRGGVPPRSLATPPSSSQTNPPPPQSTTTPAPNVVPDADSFAHVTRELLSSAVPPTIPPESTLTGYLRVVELEAYVDVFDAHQPPVPVPPATPPLLEDGLLNIMDWRATENVRSVANFFDRNVSSSALSRRNQDLFVDIVSGVQLGVNRVLVKSAFGATRLVIKSASGLYTCIAHPIASADKLYNVAITTGKNIHTFVTTMSVEKISRGMKQMQNTAREFVRYMQDPNVSPKIKIAEVTEGGLNVASMVFGGGTAVRGASSLASTVARGSSNSARAWFVMVAMETAPLPTYGGFGRVANVARSVSSSAPRRTQFPKGRAQPGSATAAATPKITNMNRNFALSQNSSVAAAMSNLKRFNIPSRLSASSSAANVLPSFVINSRVQANINKLISHATTPAAMPTTITFLPRVRHAIFTPSLPPRGSIMPRTSIPPAAVPAPRAASTAVQRGARAHKTARTASAILKGTGRALPAGTKRRRNVPASNTAATRRKLARSTTVPPTTKPPHPAVSGMKFAVGRSGKFKQVVDAIKLGARGEESVRRLLKSKGWEILVSNTNGNRGIDIIATRNGRVRLIEVKTTMKAADEAKAVSYKADVNGLRQSHSDWWSDRLSKLYELGGEKRQVAQHVRSQLENGRVQILLSYERGGLRKWSRFKNVSSTEVLEGLRYNN